MDIKELQSKAAGMLRGILNKQQPAKPVGAEPAPAAPASPAEPESSTKSEPQGTTN